MPALKRRNVRPTAEATFGATVASKRYLALLRARYLKGKSKAAEALLARWKEGIERGIILPNFPAEAKKEFLKTLKRELQRMKESK